MYYVIVKSMGKSILMPKISMGKNVVFLPNPKCFKCIFVYTSKSCLGKQLYNRP